MPKMGKYYESDPDLWQFLKILFQVLLSNVLCKGDPALGLG
jgi:hypothetical protein